MSTWLTEYLSALEARDAVEKAQEEAYNAYAKLADHTAAVQHELTSTNTAIAEVEAQQSSPTTLTPIRTRPTMTSFVTNQLPFRSTTPPSQNSPSPPLGTDIHRLRADLASAQRSKSVLTSEVSQLKAALESTQTGMAKAEKSVAGLSKEKVSLTRKLRDREEELKEKSRLVEQVQDEMLTLETQVNVIEEEKKDLKKQNDELVERWMVEKGRLADQMNREGGWMDG